jgi:hypothetical protein
VDLKWIAFGRRGKELDPAKADSALFADPCTDLATIGDAFENLGDVRRRTAGILVISDGAFNSGPDPEQWVASTGLPFSCIAMGDSGEPPDVSIEKVDAPASALVGSPCSVRVLVGSNIRTSGSIAIIGGRSRLAQRGPIPLSPGLNEVTLDARAAASGDQEWTISVDVPALAERNKRNNSRRIWVSVLKSKIRISALFESACLDQRFFQRALAQDEHILLTTKCGPCLPWDKLRVSNYERP